MRLRLVFFFIIVFPVFLWIMLKSMLLRWFPISVFDWRSQSMSSLSACGHKKSRDVATYITRDVHFISTNNSIGNLIVYGLSYGLFVVIISRTIKVTIPNVYCGFYSIGNGSLLFVVQVVCSLKNTYFPHYFRLQTKSSYMWTSVSVTFQVPIPRIGCNWPLLNLTIFTNFDTMAMRDEWNENI